VVAENDSHRITRNISFFKNVPDKIGSEEEEFIDTQENEHKIVGQEIHPHVEEPPVLRRQSTRNRTQTELFGNPVTSSIIR
jgi:hypothetical protein